MRCFQIGVDLLNLCVFASGWKSAKNEHRAPQTKAINSHCGQWNVADLFLGPYLVRSAHFGGLRCG